MFDTPEYDSNTVISGCECTPLKIITDGESDTIKEYKYLLFTQPKCPKCGPFKEKLSSTIVDIDHIDATTEVGSKLASEFGIMSTPTLLVLVNGKEETRFFDPDEFIKYDVEIMR